MTFNQNYNSQSNQSQSIADSPQHGAPPLVLIVEDHADTSFFLKTFLERDNFRVIEAGNGRLAVDLAVVNVPDLILMDYKLPEIDGVEATRRIKKFPALARTPVIFFSASAEKVFQQAAFQAGAAEYLTKPMEFAALKNTINKHLRHKAIYEKFTRLTVQDVLTAQLRN